MDDQLKHAYEQLRNLKSAAENAQQVMQQFKKEAGGFLTNAALKYYQELNEMDADDIRKFGEIISRHARGLAEDLNKLNYNVKNKV